MKSFAIAFAAAATLWAGGAAAGIHLYPDDSPLTYTPDDVVLSTAYDRLVVTVLKDGFAPDVTARVFVGGSRVIGEHLVGIRGGKGNKRLFAVWPSENLFAMAELEDKKNAPVPDNAAIAQMQAELPASAADIQEDGCEVPIDAQLAGDVETIWDVALRGTRYDSRREMEKSRRNNAGDAGEVISADSAVLRFWEGGMTGKMVAADGGLSALVDAMFDACEAHGKGLLQLKQKAATVLARLKMEGPK